MSLSHTDVSFSPFLSSFLSPKKGNVKKKCPQVRIKEMIKIKPVALQRQNMGVVFPLGHTVYGKFKDKIKLR